MHPRSEPLASPRLVLRDARVPRALVEKPAEFAGRIEHDCVRGDLLIEEGRVRRLLAPGEVVDGHSGFDLAGRVVVPRLVEPHCHLDKCHTVARLGAVGGDLHRAIEGQRRDRARWTRDDLRERAGRGLDELRSSGCGSVRTHIDWDTDRAPAGSPPLAWEVIGELAEEIAPHTVVQRSALLSLEIFDDRSYVSGVARLLAAAGGVLGVFVLGQTHMARRLRCVIELAERHGLPLDFHVDESLERPPEGLEAIARVITETGFEGPVLCGHACALMNLEGDALARLVETVARSGLSIGALPATNLYLQGRGAGTPQRRGITRVRELHGAGVTVAFGSDNVADAFCPVGRLDPMHALALAVLTAHLDPPFGPWLAGVTTGARRAIGLDPQPIDGARTADLLVADTTHTADVVRGVPRFALEEFLSANAAGAG
ncbi:MAG: amidohydrolase family protein [Thiotrichales bacterium]|nr:amidohydrolase family protein [Thiotrichales bacterium]